MIREESEKEFVRFSKKLRCSEDWKYLTNAGLQSWEILAHYTWMFVEVCVCVLTFLVAGLHCVCVCVEFIGVCMCVTLSQCHPRGH